MRTKSRIGLCSATSLLTLTKDHLVSSIGNRLGISKFESLRIVETFLETIKTSLSNGEDVLISGLRFRDF